MIWKALRRNCLSSWRNLMIVNIVDYGEREGKSFVTYEVLNLLSEQLDYLNNNLDEETSVKDGILRIVMYFTPELYPFQSNIAKIRLDDFIAREEIEMNVFLSSFLEDM